METANIELDRDEATRMWRKYQTHKDYQLPIDAEIERIYKVLAGGKVVVRALASISQAGVDDKGMPKLAIVRADATQCHCRMTTNGSGRMSDSQWVDGRTARSRFFDFPEGTFANTKHQSGVAMVPHIPPDIRPHKGLHFYHVLFEAVWSPEPPVDPILLRRMGEGDVWLVCGAWELTSVERAVMAGRL
jgi:hypothetical protein